MHPEVSQIKNKLNAQSFFKKDWFNNLLNEVENKSEKTELKQGDYIEIKKIAHVVLGFKEEKLYTIPLDTKLALSEVFWFPKTLKRIKVIRKN